MVTHHGRSIRHFYTWLAAILVAGALLHLVHFHSSFGNDDQAYTIVAQELGHHVEPSRSPPQYHGRILWASVLAIWGRLSGGIEVEHNAPLMFVLCALTAFLVAEVAKNAFGELAALIAAAFLTTHPISLAWDSYTMPDVLANVFLAGYLLLFLKYIRNGYIPTLLGCGFLVGTAFSVKDHYVLSAVPFGICLLLQPKSLLDRIRTASLFSLAVFAGISVDFLLHWWFSGSFLAHFAFNSGYAERLAAWGRPPDQIGIHLLLRRMQYFVYLLFDAGILSGIMTVWGTIYLLLRARRRVDCALIFSLILMYLVLLAFMPAAIHPFRLVEMQGCYLRILLPLLAVGCGGALAEAMQDRLSRKAMVAALVAGFGANVFVPDTTASAPFELCWNRELDGIRQTLKEGSDRGIDELWLPLGYDCATPDSFYKYKTKIHYYGSSKSLPVESLLAALQADPKRAILISRKGLCSPLIPYVKAGLYETGCDIWASDRPIAELLAKNRFEAIPLEVPASVFDGWLAYFGIKRGERILAGWVCRVKPEAKAAVAPRKTFNDVGTQPVHERPIVLTESDEPPIDPAGSPKK